MNPLLVMAILEAASMAANYAGQKKIDRGRAVAMQQAEVRRDELAQKGSAASKSTTDLLLGTPDKEKAAADARVAAEQRMTDAVNPLTKQTTDQLVSSTFAPSNSQRVIEDTAMARAQSKKFLDQQAKAGAALSSFGDVTANNNIAVQRNQQDINQNTNSMQNWNQFVLPAQMEAANQSGRGYQTLADVIQAASMIYGGVGLAKGAATAGQGLNSGLAAGTNTVLTPAASAANLPTYMQGWAPQAADNAYRFYDAPFSRAMIGPYQ